MLYTRLEAEKIGLAAGLAAAYDSKLTAAGKPNSKITGVQIGAITYSYRSMPDQSAEATLQYDFSIMRWHGDFRGAVAAALRSRKTAESIVR